MTKKTQAEEDLIAAALQWRRIRHAHDSVGTINTDTKKPELRPTRAHVLTAENVLKRCADAVTVERGGKAPT